MIRRKMPLLEAVEEAGNSGGGSSRTLGMRGRGRGTCSVAVLVCSVMVALYLPAVLLLMTPWTIIAPGWQEPRSCVHLYTEESLRARVGIVTFQDGMDRVFVEHSEQNKRDYAARHGYDLLISDELLPKPNERKRPVAWEKFNILLHHLETEKYDLLLWIDTDAIIMNLTIRVEWIASSKFSDQDLFFSEDENGINSGVFIIRNSPWTRWFLKECEKQYSWLGFEGPFQFEQRAIHYMFDTDIIKRYLKRDNDGTIKGASKGNFERSAEVWQHSIIVPHCALNANACEEFKSAIFLLRAQNIDFLIGKGIFCDNPYHYGDFIVHLAGKQPKWYRRYLAVNFAKIAAMQLV